MSAGGPSEFEVELALLLERVAERGSDPATIDAAAERCARAFERLHGTPGSASQAASAAARRYLALLTELAAHELADTERRLQLARAARRALALQSEREGAAGVCDYAG